MYVKKKTLYVTETKLIQDNRSVLVLVRQISDKNLQLLLNPEKVYCPRHSVQTIANACNFNTKFIINWFLPF